MANKDRFEDLDKQSFSYMKFCFTFLEKNNRLDSEDYKNVFEEFTKLSSMPFVSLMSAGKKNGFNLLEVKKAHKLKSKNPNICDEKRIIGNKKWKDLKVMVIRFGQKNVKKRIIGYCRDKHLYVLYIDHDGSLYKH